MKRIKVIFNGTLLFRKEPDTESRICGSASYGTELVVEDETITSAQGETMYQLVGGGYFLADTSYTQDILNGDETAQKINEAVEKAETATQKAEVAAKTCESIANGINTMIDTVTGTPCALSVEDSILTIREA